MRKFKALVHHIIHECARPDQLGAIRLNKVLWFSDVTAFRIEGKPITTEKYVKRQRGPVPRRILQALKALEASGDIAIVEPEHEFDTRKLMSVKSPRSKLLTSREKLITSAVLSAVLDRTANEISEMSHDDIWRAAAEGEEIPLCATLATMPGESSTVRARYDLPWHHQARWLFVREWQDAHEYCLRPEVRRDWTPCQGRLPSASASGRRGRE